MDNYNTPIKEMLFSLTQVADINKYSKDSDKTDLSSEDVKLLLEEAGKFARENLDNINAKGDLDGIKLENGLVRMPEYFITAYKSFVESGWFSVVGDKKYGGQDFPWSVLVLINESQRMQTTTTVEIERTKMK